MEYVWIAVVILSIVFEFVTPGLVAIWFMPAALISMVLAFCGVYVWVQVPVFLIVSILCIIFARPLINRRQKPMATNIDAIIGERAIVVEKIENIAGAGQVKVRGQSWSARTVDDDCTYEPGDIVTVIAVEGVKLICKK